MKVTQRPDGRFDVTQSFISPTVYLDHWAVRDLTDNVEWQDRFVAALRASGGTLVLSILNFSEFAQVDHPRHAYESERFLDRLLPSVFFASFALDDVLRNELRHQPHAPPTPPPERRLIEYFATKHPPMCFDSMIRPLIGNKKARRDAVGMNRIIAAHINRVRQSPAFIRASRTFADHEPGAPALAVFRELSRITASDQLMRIEPNDSTDFQHAVVSLAYCTYALLDRKWVDFAARVQRNLDKLRVRIQLARAFSKRQMGNFLDCLERHPNRSIP